MLTFFLEDGNYEGGEKWNKLQKGKKTTWLVNTKVHTHTKKKEEEKGKIAIKQEIATWGLEKTHSLNFLSGNYQNPVQVNFKSFKLCKWAWQIWNSFFNALNGIYL